MNEKVKLVDYQELESFLIKVEGFLLSKGFDFIPKNNSLDIVRVDPEAKPRKYLFGLVTLRPRRESIGTVRLGRRTDINKHYWVFEVYNHKHIYPAKQLADEMASNFDIKIVLLHVRGQLGLETCNVIKYYGV